MSALTQTQLPVRSPADIQCVKDESGECKSTPAATNKPELDVVQTVEDALDL